MSQIQKSIAGILGLTILTASPLNLVQAESSILLTIMNASKAIVDINSETAVILGDKPKAGLVKDVGIVIQKKVTPIVHSRKGIGIVIDPNGLIITNAHVVNKASRITITLHDQSIYEAKLLAINPATDVALLWIHSTEPLPAIKFADSTQTRLDDHVYTIGGSALTRDTISEGSVSGLAMQKSASRSKDDSVRFLRVRFNIYEGDSGTPLLNAEGNLLGMMAASARKKEKVAYAIPSHEILLLIQDYLDEHPELVAATTT